MLKENAFLDDIYMLRRACDVDDNVECSVVNDWKEYFDDINNYLYQKLNKLDRDILIRFFLKRFYKVDTATQDEIKQIEIAYNAVKELYTKSNKHYLEFEFRNRKILYKKNMELKDDETLPENVLMNYYDIAHAFYLVEYEKDGFNPTDGQTILDCGGAYGDTLLLFKALYPNSPIHTFEAVLENVNKINENVKLNRVKDAVVKSAFLYSDSQKHYINKDNYRIVCDKADNTIEIETLSIDDYVEENMLTNIGLIKFDIEGGEQEALKGSIRTIREQKPLLYIPLYHCKSDIYKIPQFLASLNMPMQFSIKWTEKKVWGMDCVLFVRFDKD